MGYLDGAESSKATALRIKPIVHEEEVTQNPRTESVQKGIIM